MGQFLTPYRVMGILNVTKLTAGIIKFGINMENPSCIVKG